MTSDNGTRQFIFTFNRSCEADAKIISMLESKGRGGMKNYVSELILKDVNSNTNISDETLLEQLNKKYSEQGIRFYANNASTLAKLFPDISKYIEWSLKQDEKLPFIVDDGKNIITINRHTLESVYVSDEN